MSWMHDDASPSSVYTTACKSVHLMPEAFPALLGVPLGVSKLHSHTKSRIKKRRSSLRISSAPITRKLMEIGPSAPVFSLATIRFDEYLRLPVPNTTSNLLRLR